MDNKSALHWGANGFSTKLSHLAKSVGLRVAWLRDLVQERVVRLYHVSGTKNPANVLTKAVDTAVVFERERAMLGVRYCDGVDELTSADTGTKEVASSEASGR